MTTPTLKRHLIHPYYIGCGLLIISFLLGFSLQSVVSVAIDLISYAESVMLETLQLIEDTLMNKYQH